jgi:hypothetical protein
MTEAEYNALKLGDHVRPLSALFGGRAYPKLVGKVHKVDFVHCSKTSVVWSFVLRPEHAAEYGVERLPFSFGDAELATNATLAKTPRFPHECHKCGGPAWYGAAPADFECMSDCDQ